MHLHVRDAGEEQGKAAPAAADVEHALTRREAELGGDMRLLRRLRGLEAHLRLGEIGAAILEVGIEEEPEEVGREIVMMGDVAARAALPVPVVEQGAEPARPPAQGVSRAVLLPCQVERDELEQVAYVAILDRQAAVHEGLAEAERRVAQDASFGAAAREADRHRLQALARRSERALPPVAADDRQRTGADQGNEQPVQQSHQARQARRGESRKTIRGRNVSHGA